MYNNNNAYYAGNSGNYQQPYNNNNNYYNNNMNPQSNYNAQYNSNNNNNNNNNNNVAGGYGYNSNNSPAGSYSNYNSYTPNLNSNPQSQFYSSQPSNLNNNNNYNSYQSTPVSASGMSSGIMQNAYANSNNSTNSNNQSKPAIIANPGAGWGNKASGTTTFAKSETSGTLKQIPLTCTGHTRPVVDLCFSSFIHTGEYFLISACKGACHSFYYLVYLCEDGPGYLMGKFIVRFHSNFAEGKYRRLGWKFPM
jgi:hypothetical protein